MERSAYFGVYRRLFGVPPIDGGTVRLPRLVGQGRALEIILTGRKVPAEECERIGLAEFVLEDGESRAKAEALAHEISRFPQACMRADRRAVIRQHGLPMRDAMLRTIQVADIVGIRAFVTHAKNDQARAFYEYFDFVPLATDPYHLYCLIKDIRRLTGE